MSHPEDDQDQGHEGLAPPPVALEPPGESRVVPQPEADTNNVDKRADRGAMDDEQKQRVADLLRIISWHTTYITSGEYPDPDLWPYPDYGPPDTDGTSICNSYLRKADEGSGDLFYGQGYMVTTPFGETRSMDVDPADSHAQAGLRLLKSKLLSDSLVNWIDHWQRGASGDRRTLSERMSPTRQRRHQAIAIPRYPSWESLSSWDDDPIGGFRR
ncbi:hypothetical protein B0H21DRAFT_881981 [Amylocystis lapponica]|nr:hypothetical protein B0H21DRAFT_881981 [Amylocystis lapponica]